MDYAFGMRKLGFALLFLLFFLSTRLLFAAPSEGTPLLLSPRLAPLAGTDASSGATTEAPADPAQPDAVSAATGHGQGSRFLGFPSKTAFHKFAGWTSGGLLLAAGVVGGIRAYDLMNSGHDYRDAQGITEEDQIGAQCTGEISSLWGDSAGQALRWTHVGLLAAGESLYLANAITGIGFMEPLEPGLSSRRIHRYAFFGHAFLMAAEATLGFLTTDALRRGDHEAVTKLGVAHAGVGFAIPVLILGAGAVIELGR